MEPILETPSIMSDDLQQAVGDKVITFPVGLPGFPDERRFVLASDPAHAPFVWLTSLDTADLSFICVEPRFVLQEFTFDVDDSELEVIGFPKPLETGLLLIVRIESGETPRLLANLRAPVVINLSTRQARQVILGDECGLSDSHPIGT
jgi:flagellar assembly factor FliW